MADWRKDFEDAIERNQREAQRQRNELQAWIDRNAERRHREAEERHWRRMEQQGRTSPIVVGLAAYGAYRAYEAFTSDEEEEKVRKQKWEQIKQNTEAQIEPELAFLDAVDELYAAVRESNPTDPRQVAALDEFARAYDAWEDHPRKPTAIHDILCSTAREPIDGETKFGFIVWGILAVVITIVAVRFLFG